MQCHWSLPDVSSFVVTVELEVTAAVSVVTDAQAVLSESTDEALPLATAEDAVSLDTNDVSDDDGAKMLTDKQVS